MALPRTPHLLIEAVPESAPTRPLLAALAGNWLAESRTVDAQEAAVHDRLPVLRVTPHPDLDACGHAEVHLAYTVRWSIPVPTGQRTLRLDRPGIVIAQDEDDATDSLGWHDLALPQTLHAELLPQAHRDALREQQLADADRTAAEDDLSDFTPARLRLIGGEDAARRLIRNRARAAAGYLDWADRADWAGLADRLEALRAEPAPRLAPVRRLALAGAARIILAERQEANTQSLKALTGNVLASKALLRADTAAVGAVTRQTLNAWHPKEESDATT